MGVRIANLVKMVNTGMILILLVILLVVPVYLLYRLEARISTPNSAALSIIVLLVFTLTFGACVCLFTKARLHELLAASAAYCAVLVVFLGNIGPPPA